MQEIIQIFSVVMLFLFVIGSHEFGHLIAAKRVGLTVKEFALGMGPQLFAVMYNETKYSLRLVPLGGFVTILGISKEDPAWECLKFESLRLRSKIFVYISGIVCNIIVCWLIYTVLFAVGFTAIFPSFAANNTKAIVTTVEQKSISLKSGLKSGDIILEFNKRPILSSTKLVEEIDKNRSGIFKIQRGNKTLDITIKPKADQPLGFSIADHVSAAWYLAPVYALGHTLLYFLAGFLGIFMFFKDLAGFHIPVGASGPIGISVMAYQTSGDGIAAYLQLLAIICVCVATFNLLPVAPLDGGHIFFSIVKKIAGRRLKPKYVEAAQWAGVVPILLLIVTICLNDILRLFK